MQLVTASDTAHLMSANSVTLGSSWARNTAAADRASPSLTDSDGNLICIRLMTCALRGALSVLVRFI